MARGRKASGKRFPVEKMFYRTIELHTIKYLVWNGEEMEERTVENKIGKNAETIVESELNKNEKLLKVVSDEVQKKIAYMEIEEFLKQCKFWDAEQENGIDSNSSFPEV